MLDEFGTLALTIAAIVGGLVLGIALALMRMSPLRPISTLAQAYIWLFRGTPLLVQLLIIYTGLLLAIGVRFSVLEAALLGLILNEAAYLAKIVRSGILSVPEGQSNAAKALGFTNAQVMRCIVMPQATHNIIPPLGNSVNGLLKTTLVTSAISMEELLRRSQILIQEKFLVLELFAVAAIYYLILTTLWDIVQRRIEARYGKRLQQDPGPGRLLVAWPRQLVPAVIAWVDGMRPSFWGLRFSRIRRFLVVGPRHCPWRCHRRSIRTIAW